MEATVYDMEAIRSRRNSATGTETYSQMQRVQDGLGLMLAATSFWVEFAVAMASFQASLLSRSCSPSSK